MSGVRGRERLQPSLLDRLTDNAPAQNRDAADQQVINLPQLRQAVLRDLAALMNTTNLAATNDLSSTPRVGKSTLNYGIPGFAGLAESSFRVEALEREIADAIRNFEPRIKPESLKVRARGSREDDPNPALVFEIEGELWAQPLPLQLFVQTAIEIETRLAVVTESKGSQ